MYGVARRAREMTSIRRLNDAVCVRGMLWHSKFLHTLH